MNTDDLLVLPSYEELGGRLPNSPKGWWNYFKKPPIITLSDLKKLKEQFPSVEGQPYTMTEWAMGLHPDDPSLSELIDKIIREIEDGKKKDGFKE